MASGAVEGAGEEKNAFVSGSDAFSTVVCSTINSEDIMFSLQYQQSAFVPHIPSAHCPSLDTG